MDTEFSVQDLSKYGLQLAMLTMTPGMMLKDRVPRKRVSQLLFCSFRQQPSATPLEQNDSDSSARNEGQFNSTPSWEQSAEGVKWLSYFRLGMCQWKASCPINQSRGSVSLAPKVGAHKLAHEPIYFRIVSYFSPQAISTLSTFPSEKLGQQLPNGLGVLHKMDINVINLNISYTTENLGNGEILRVLLRVFLRKLLTVTLLCFSIWGTDVYTVRGWFLFDLAKLWK